MNNDQIKGSNCGYMQLDKPVVNQRLHADFILKVCYYNHKITLT